MSQLNDFIVTTTTTKCLTTLHYTYLLTQYKMINLWVVNSELVSI